MKISFPYRFKNQNLLIRALTHRSYLNEHPEEELVSNERLEYLGDAVLELITSEYLYQKYLRSEEGKLTSLRARLVQTKTLSLAAQKLNIGRHLRISRGEEKSGGRENPSILADTFEAVIGAIYLDGGYEQAQDFTSKYLLRPAEELFSDKLPINYKSKLQEKIQAQGKPSPTYSILSTQGPDHRKTFKVAVMVHKSKLASGKGSSKQLAEQQAAKKALEKIEEN